MAKLIRRQQVVKDSDLSDVHLIKRDDRKITFVTGDDLLQALSVICLALQERGDSNLAGLVAKEIGNL